MANNEDDELKEITLLFCDEATDLLADIDAQILRLEEKPIDSGVIDNLFRRIHTIKGASGAILGGSELARLSHQFETTLGKLKNENAYVTPEAINTFLGAADLSKKLVECIRGFMSSDDLKSEVTSTVATLQALNFAPPVGATTRVAEQKTAAPTQQGKMDDQGYEDEGVFVTNEKLDMLMKLSGELVVLKNNFQMITRQLEARTEVEKVVKRAADFAFILNKVTDHIQGQMMSVRRVTLNRALSKLPRLVRQISQDLKKKVNFEMVGFETSVDKNIAKVLSNCLTHMVRNSMDHGIEPPDIRKTTGKGEEASLRISARESQSIVEIIVEDDGAGISKEKVKKKAIHKGLILPHQADAMSEQELLELIFLPGFTTADQVSSLSGRGVGMDVVRSQVLALHGRVKLESYEGVGTKFVLEIPVPKTVMVEETIVAQSDGVNLTIPMTGIARISPVKDLKVIRVGDLWTCQFDGVTVKLFKHRHIDSLKFGDWPTPPKGHIVFMKYKSVTVGMVVDAIHDQLEAVIRPFDPAIGSLPGFKGTTILADDQIAYVVAANEAAERVMGIA